MSDKINVLLVQPPIHKSIDRSYASTQIPINLGYIAASLEQEGANVKIVDFCVNDFIESEFIALLREFNPAFVGFTGMTSSMNFVRDIAKLVKQYDSGLLTVLGGVHISAIPKRTMEEIPHVDVGVMSEGEETIKEIYRLKAAGKPLEGIKGTIIRTGEKLEINPMRELIKNVDTIPFPARHLFDVKKYNKSHVSRGFSRKYLNIMELITTRGCPNQCIFCAGHINYGYMLRARSYENVKAEIEELIKNYGTNHISIQDDTFTLNKELVKRLCAYLKEKKLSWDCNARVNTVDFELLKLMKASGCKKISFGVESGSPRILKLIKKGITLEQVRAAFAASKKAGIRYTEGTFILGSHPSETEEEVRQTVDLIFELMPDFASLTIICPFPGTEVYRLMDEQKLLDENLDWSKFTFINNTPPFRRLEHLTAEQLVETQKKFLKTYYSSPRYILSQIIKMRSIGEVRYFINLGKHLVKEFFFKTK